jgi:hypothetical protein
MKLREREEQVERLVALPVMEIAIAGQHVEQLGVQRDEAALTGEVLARGVELELPPVAKHRALAAERCEAPAQKRRAGAHLCAVQCLQLLGHGSSIDSSTPLSGKEKRKCIAGPNAAAHDRRHDSGWQMSSEISCFASWIVDGGDQPRSEKVS